MKKLKIGFFTDTYIPQVNGVVTSIELFRKEMEKQGHEVYIFAPSPKQKSDTKKIFRFHSMKFLPYPGIRIAIPYSRAAHESAKKIKLDIIHSHDPFSIGLFGLWLAKKFKIPYIHTYHTLYPEYVHYIWKAKITENLAKKMSRDFCNQCSAIVSPSTKIKNKLKKWGVKKSIATIATGINLSEIKKTTKKEVEEFKKELGIEKNDKIVLFLSRIAKEKNIDFLLSAAKKMEKESVKFIITGDGPYRKEAEEKSKKRKIKNIMFTGYIKREQIPKIYKAANVFAFPSTSETQGLVIAEAMTSGLPVIAVKDSATADIVTNNYNGYLTNKNIKDFSGKIKKVLNGKKIHAKFSKNAKETVKNFSIEKKSKELLGLYQEQIDKNIDKKKNIS